MVVQSPVLIGRTDLLALAERRIGAVRDGTTSDRLHDPAGVDAAPRELHDRFFVQPRGDGPAYDFRHALIRDALCADLTPHRRRDRPVATGATNREVAQELSISPTTVAAHVEHILTELGARRRAGIAARAAAQNLAAG